jgi:hypothetical protein
LMGGNAGKNGFFGSAMERGFVASIGVAITARLIQCSDNRMPPKS